MNHKLSNFEKEEVLRVLYYHNIYSEIYNYQNESLILIDIDSNPKILKVKRIDSQGRRVWEEVFIDIKKLLQREINTKINFITN